MARYDDDLKVGSNHGNLTVGDLRKRLEIARAHSPATGRMNPNCLAASQTEETRIIRAESVRDYWRSERAAAHREKVREAMRENQKKFKGHDFSDEWREQQSARMAWGGSQRASDARWGATRQERQERNQAILHAFYVDRMTQAAIAERFGLSVPRVSRICATIPMIG